MDCIEHAHANNPRGEKVREVGEGKRRASRLVVEPGRRSSRTVPAVGSCQRDVELFATVSGGLWLRRHDREAHSNSRGMEPGGFDDCLGREVHDVGEIKGSGEH